MTRIIGGLFIRGLARLVACVPFRWLPVGGALLGWCCGQVLRIRRRHVIEAMRAAGVSRPRVAADGMYRSLGTSLLELLWLGGREEPGGAEGLRSCVIDGPSRAVIARAKQEGRGVVLAGGHTGNWELSAAALAEREDVLVVAKPLHVGIFDAFARRTRARYAVRLADPHGALSVAQETLARGGCVTLLVDQVPDVRSHGVLAPFLGRPVLAPRAAAALAWRTGAPLLVVASHRVSSGGGHALCVLGRLTPGQGDGRGWIDEATVCATRMLEAFVLSHPTEWLWLHRRWRMPGAPAAALSSGEAVATQPSPCRTLSSSRAARSTAGSSSARASTGT